jgi:MFS family permease
MSALRARLRGALAEQGLSSRLWTAFPPVLRVVAEGGWLTVLYAAASVLADKHAPVIGPIEMCLFVVAGVVIRAVGRREPTLGAFLLIGGVVVAGVIGSLAGPQASELGRSWLHPVGAHFAGWLCGIAVLRGAVVSTTEKAADQLDQMFRVVPVGIGLTWAYTTSAGRVDLWLPFAVAALWGTMMYLSGSLVAIGLSRLKILHAEVTDERQRRGWRWLVFATGFGIVPLAIPIAMLAGIPLAAIAGPLVGPIQWLLGLVAYPLAFIIWILSMILRPIAGPLGELMDRIGQNVIQIPQDPTETRDVATIAAGLILFVTLLVIALAVYGTARWLLSRREEAKDLSDPEPGDVERSIVLPAPEAPPARPRRRRATPRDAVAAYAAAVGELAGRAPFGRDPSETPRGHATRVASLDMPGSPDFKRLAAGYQLARYGERPITARENVRAVDRLRRFRRLLRMSRA